VNELAASGRLGRIFERGNVEWRGA
jgi:hypothetical protein